MESEVENVRIERIKEKNELTEKFEIDKEKLAKIALDLEKSMEDLKVEFEKSEESAANSIGKYIDSVMQPIINNILGRISDLELDIIKNQDIASALKEELSAVSEKYTSLNQTVEKEKASNEKKMKSKERQIQELKKELQKAIEKSEVIVPAKIELVAPDVSNGNLSKGFDEAPLDTDYLKHIVLRFISLLFIFYCIHIHRYITAKTEDREHLIKALSTILNFSPEDKKVISDFMVYKKSWFGVSKPQIKRGSLAPSIQNSK